MAQTMSGQWSYPLEETNGNARVSTSRRDTSGSQESGQAGTKSVRRIPSDAWNVLSDSEGTKQRRQSLKATNAGASRKRSRNTLRGREKPPEVIDDSAWIHRDKLAQIEIMEMEQAGIPVRQSRRSTSAGPGADQRTSRSQSRARKSVSEEQVYEEVPEEAYGMAYGGEEDYENFERKRISTIPDADQEEREFDPTTDYEFRTPEELAREQEVSRTSVRPSTSRIPVSKASPVPVPQNVVGRDSPLPRSRNGSASYSGTWDDMLYARKARSGSIGSQAVLDDEEGVRTPLRPDSSHMHSSSENSPPKSRVPNRSTPNGRKGSVQNGIPRPGSSSGNKARTTSAKERSTSSAHKSRPSTSHAYSPEGEAPWISSMYKPDPRLPPDQQMLPTHAKRMMQEQWEKEGKSGTTYDRDLRPISDQELPAPTSKSQAPPPLELNQQNFGPEKVPSPSPSPNLQLQTNNAPTTPNSTNMNAWPLTQQSDQRSGSRPGTSGGYKITPKIASPPQIQRPEASPARSPAPPTNPTPRVPDLDEKEEVQPKKGGCGCCVVM